MFKKKMLRCRRQILAAAFCVSIPSAPSLHSLRKLPVPPQLLQSRLFYLFPDRPRDAYALRCLLHKQKVQKEFEQYLDDYFKDAVTEDTMTYNYSIKNGADYGIEEPEVTLGDPGMTEEGIKEDKAEFDKWVDELEKIDRACLTEDQKLTYDVLDEYFDVAAGVYDNVYLYEPFSPMRGLQANIASMFTDYRFDDKGDVERYIELLGQIPEYFQEYLDFEKEKSEKGYFMSDEVCQKVINQCQTFIENKDDHFMVTVFNDNMDRLDFLSDEEKTEF